MPRSDAARRATAILHSQKSTSSPLNPIRSAADKVLQLWKTREAISEHTGFQIPGVSAFNRQLERLSSDTEVDQCNLDSDLKSGSIFIEVSTGRLLGETIVEKRDKTNEVLELESALFSPSRKSA
jgi:hypothetical protein